MTDKALKFDDVLQIDDLPRDKVDIPEWGGHVYIRSLRADERAEIEKLYARKKPSDDPGGFRAELLSRTLVNDDGTPWMPKEKARDLLKKSAKVVEGLVEKALAKNGFSRKDADQLEKN